MSIKYGHSVGNNAILRYYRMHQIEKSGGQSPQSAGVGASPFASSDLPTELPLAPLTLASDFALDDKTSDETSIFTSESRDRRSGALLLSCTAVCVVEPCCPCPGCDRASVDGGAGPVDAGSTLRRRVSSSTQRYIVLEMPSSTRSRSSIASRVSTSK
jgi:hypothetical protein